MAKAKAVAALPDIGSVPEVFAARAKRDELRAELAKVRAGVDELTATGSDLPGDPVEREARLLLGGDDLGDLAERVAAASDRADRLANLKRREPILAKAVELATEATARIERQAAAKLQPEAVAAIFAPAVRTAALAFLDAAKAIDDVRAAHSRLTDAGFGPGIENPYLRHLPLAVDPDSGFVDVAKLLISAGVVSRAEVVERIPVLDTWRAM